MFDSMMRPTWMLSAVVSTFASLYVPTTCHADLIGYWSGNSTAGAGGDLPNDQGNDALNGELFGGAGYSDAGKGITGMAGDFALSFPGEDSDYAVIPPTELTFEQITITAWVNGVQNGDWAGIVVSRDPAQPIGLDYHAFSGMVNYIWNNDSSATWNFQSDLVIPEDEWAFVALTITEEEAVLYLGELGGELDSAVNAIEHFPQDNLTEWRFAEDDCCGANRNFAGLMDEVSIWDEALSQEDLARLHDLSATPLTLRGPITLGDFNNDSILDAADIDLLSTAVLAGSNDPQFDLDGNGVVDNKDRTVWVNDLRKTWFGDANLDGIFNTTDFIEVFQNGEYEDAVQANSTWREGDWSGDADFDSTDFVLAFQANGFEKGPRAATAAVAEPSSGMAVLLIILPAFRRRQRRRLRSRRCSRVPTGR